MKIIKRQCKSCKQIKNRDEMIKITLNNDKLTVNPDSKTTGRSVYVCKSKECIELLIKSKGIKRGLKYNNEEEIKKAESLILSSCNPE